MNTRAIHEMAASVQLTLEQRDILVGMLLGDGCLETSNRGRTYRLRVEHSLNQKEYVDWLYEWLKPLVLTGPRLKRQIVEEKEYSKYHFSTIATGAFRFYGQQFYPQGKKLVPIRIAKWMTPLALAVWFMDDGSRKSRFHRALLLNTQGFVLGDVQRLREMLEKRFGVFSTLRKQREGMQICISYPSSEKFTELIRPYVLPSMEYKLKSTPLHKL